MSTIMIALTGLMLAGNTASAFANGAIENEVQNRQQRPRNNQQRNMTSVDPQEYAKKRLEAITKAAGLTEAEKAIVAEELAKYDNERLQTWVETRQIYDDIAQLGDKATDKHFRDSLIKLTELNDQRHNASQNFIKALTQKLSPKKAYLVYHSQRNFNANTGRRLRQE